jgi:DNA-binding CsgD family transcriptional regulator
MITPYQIKIIELIAAGKSNKELSNEMGLAYHTMYAHYRRAKAKLNASSPAHLVYIAMKEGIIK